MAEDPFLAAPSSVTTRHERSSVDHRLGPVTRMCSVSAMRPDHEWTAERGKLLLNRAGVTPTVLGPHHASRYVWDRRQRSRNAERGTDQHFRWSVLVRFSSGQGVRSSSLVLIVAGASHGHLRRCRPVRQPRHIQQRTDCYQQTKPFARLFGVTEQILPDDYQASRPIFGMLYDPSLPI
jgi:hypothetical protein